MRKYTGEAVKNRKKRIVPNRIEESCSLSSLSESSPNERAKSEHILFSSKGKTNQARADVYRSLCSYVRV